MIQDETPYFNWLQKTLNDFFGKRVGIKVFLFGRSIQSKTYGDIDIGLIGDISEQEACSLKEIFSESNFPYVVDIVNFNRVDENFKRNVFNNKIIWIKE